MIRFKNKHVCNPGARKSSGKQRYGTDKVQIVAIEKLPADYVPEPKPKKRRRKPMEDNRSDKIAKGNAVYEKTNIPRHTITCGGYQQVKKARPNRKINYDAFAKQSQDLMALARYGKKVN